MNDKHSFQIAMLDKNLDFQPPGLGYTVESSWPVLQEAYPSKLVYKIIEDDIRIYDWTKQTIELTPQASSKFIDFFQCPSNDKYPICTDLYSFVILIDGVPSYGGRFLSSLSPAGIEFPVIYNTISNGIVTFRIRPYHTPIIDRLNDPAWDVIKNENVKLIFFELRKLVE